MVESTSRPSSTELSPLEDFGSNVFNQQRETLTLLYHASRLSAKSMSRVNARGCGQGNLSLSSTANCTRARGQMTGHLADNKLSALQYQAFILPRSHLAQLSARLRYP